MRRGWCLFAACLSFSTGWGFANTTSAALSSLSPKQINSVLSGTQVVLTEDVVGHPWPRAHLYQIIDASPEEVMAVFFDYEKVSEYVPNCKRSVISQTIDPRTSEVDFVVDIPILPDEAYTVRNRLSEIGPKKYKIEWNILRATSVESSVGFIEVEPYQGKTLVQYVNLVKPASKMAGLLRGMALNQMKDTLHATVRYVLHQKTHNQDGLKQQLHRFAEALNGRYPTQYASRQK